MLEYLPRDFYNVNIKIINDVSWLSKGNLPHKIDTDRYVYRIFNVEYLKYSREFQTAVEQERMWDKLND